MVVFLVVVVVVGNSFPDSNLQLFRKQQTGLGGSLSLAQFPFLRWVEPLTVLPL